MHFQHDQHHTPLLTVDDHGEMRVDAQNWAAAAIESKSDEKEISRAIKVKQYTIFTRILGCTPPSRRCLSQYSSAVL